MSPSLEIQQRLESEANIWLACVRPDGRPHLTPVWFVWHAQQMYACIQAKSVKAGSLERNPRVALSLENGSSPVICEGTVTFVAEPWPQVVADRFQTKYDWNINTDADYDRLLAIKPVKWLSW
jgi:hypothetical protein